MDDYNIINKIKEYGKNENYDKTIVKEITEHYVIIYFIKLLPIKYDKIFYINNLKYNGIIDTKLIIPKNYLITVNNMITKQIN